MLGRREKTPTTTTGSTSAAPTRRTGSTSVAATTGASAPRVSLLKRRTPAPVEPVVEKVGGKGRPTPKRSEAEKNRKARTVPTSRKEAYRQQRDEAKAERLRRRQALVKGDPRALPRRDQGPVRAFVRDYVDARRSVAEFFILFAVVVLVASVLPFDILRVLGFYLWALMLLFIILDSVALSMRLKRELRQRFPDEDRKGVTSYAIMRSTQLRRMRLPKPRVSPGATV